LKAPVFMQKDELPTKIILGNPQHKKSRRL
jgi:hypothetical protein